MISSYDAILVRSPSIEHHYGNIAVKFNCVLCTHGTITAHTAQCHSNAVAIQRHVDTPHVYITVKTL